MKTTVYRHSNVNVERTVGLYPSYTLYALPCDADEFCDPIEVELPEGFSVVKCTDGFERIEDAQGRICDLITYKDHGFWVWPQREAGPAHVYVRVDDPAWDGHGFGPYTATVKVKR